MARIVVEGGGLRVDGRRIPLLQAEFHYYRNHADAWPRILDRIRDAGFPLVTSFVQWNWHETAPGCFDFDGATGPQRDLPRLFDLCAERGLGVHLRLSPACCEWRESGASSFGTPWRRCFDAFWETARRFTGAADAPLWMLQVHNEWSDLIGSYDLLARYPAEYDGFREPPVPYDLELSGVNAHYRSAGRQFEARILARHAEDIAGGSLAALNARWSTSFPSWDALASWLEEISGNTLRGFIDAIDRRWRDRRPGLAPPAMLLDLLDACRLYMAYAIRGDVDYVRSVCDLPLTHNWAMGDGDAFDRRAHIDLSGYDMYAPTSVKAYDWQFTMADLQANELSYAGEFMCGVIDRPLWGGQGTYTPGFARLEILSWVALGLRGVSLYMFVERDNWRCCPVDREGGIRPAYDAIRSVVHALRASGIADWRRRFDLRVVKFLPYHEAAGDVPECHFDRGFSALPWLRPFLYGEEDPKKSFFNLFHALSRSQIDFEVVKVEPHGRDPRGAPVLLVYALPWIDRTLAERLDVHARQGGTVVFYPCVPAYDMRGEALGLFEGLPRTEAAADIAGCLADSEGGAVAALGPRPEFAVRPISGVRNATRRLRRGGTEFAAFVHWGAGRIAVVGADLGASDSLLEHVLCLWCGAASYAAADAPDAGAASFETDEGCAVIAFNGGKEPARDLEVANLPPGFWHIRDALGNAGIEGAGIAVMDSVVSIPTVVPPRDAVFLTLRRAEVCPDDDLRVAARPRHVPQPVRIADWTFWQEPEEVRLAPYLGSIDDASWVEVPAAEWTLPALASGRVLGVQGWFWLRHEVEIEAGRPLQVRIRPCGWHNLGIVHWDGVQIGTYACERPGGESWFNVPESFQGPGRHSLAIRLFRQTLECHDRGASGFDRFDIETTAGTARVERLLLAQEDREHAMPPADAAWAPVDLPWRGSLRRAQDRVWFRTQAPEALRNAGHLQLDGSNAVVAVYLNGQRLASTPYLPVDLPLEFAASRERPELLLRVDPDPAEQDTMRRESRYDEIIVRAQDPLDVRIDPPAFLCR